MRLLLLLSAFLTALVGQGATARAAPVPAAVACVSVGSVERAASVAVFASPRTAGQDRASFDLFHVEPAPVTTRPAYADRLLI